MIDPTQMLPIFQTMSKVPGGRTAFSKLVGKTAPYTGSIPFKVQALDSGRAVVTLYDRRSVRNHLKSVHAIALMNVGEVATGLAMYVGLPKGSRGIIVDLGMTYVKKARGNITATCECEVPTQSGKHDIEVEASLRNTDDVEVARARAVWRIDIP